MDKSANNNKRFWNKWFSNQTTETLETYLESQGFFYGEENYKGKYPLEDLQLWTFYEIFGFLWCSIESKYTNLPLTIYVDEVGACKIETYSDFPLFSTQPKIMVCNNYSNNRLDVIPITISLKPEILEDMAFVKISNKDIDAVKSFIIKNYDVLMKHWNHKLSTIELYSLFR